MIRRCLAVTCPNLRSWMRWGVYGKWGGFLDRREQAFDWTAFEALLSPIPRPAGARGLSAPDDVQDGHLIRPSHRVV